MKQSLAARLRQLRREKGWSQEKLAEEAGMHRTYLAGIERSLRNPSLENLVKLANALGITMPDLLPVLRKLPRPAAPRGRSKKDGGAADSRAHPPHPTAFTLDLNCCTIPVEITPMLRAILVIALLAAIHLSAADFSGRWAGTIETNGSRVPLYLTLNEQDGKIGGLCATGVNTKPVAIENAALHNGKLAFEVRDNTNRLMTFRLTLTGGVLAGEAKMGTQVSKVGVVQVGGGYGDRAGAGAGIGIGSAAGGSVGIGSGVYRVGGGVSAPVLIRKVEPEYTEEARTAKYQGTVLLYAEIAPDGTATNIRVARGLGLGLDQKAIEAVKQWKFKPGEKDGKAVTVAATIEVNFRL